MNNAMTVLEMDTLPRATLEERAASILRILDSYGLLKLHCLVREFREKDPKWLPNHYQGAFLVVEACFSTLDIALMCEPVREKSFAYAKLLMESGDVDSFRCGPLLPDAVRA
jgi:hypothetical protein